MPDLYVIYLHGFLSSPQSDKAQQAIRYCRDMGMSDRIEVPALHPGPSRAAAQVQGLIDRRQPDHHVALIGSSLATCLAQRNGLRAALINPAVHPQEYWHNYFGEHRNYHTGQVHQVTEQDVLDLADLDPPVLSRPENFLLLVQTGDEVLDYRRAVARYRGATQVVQQGGDHSFRNFPELLPMVFDFLAIQN